MAKKVDKKLIYLLIGVIAVLVIALVYFVLNPISTPVTVSSETEAVKTEKDVSKQLTDIKDALEQINQKLK